MFTVVFCLSHVACLDLCLSNIYDGSSKINLRLVKKKNEVKIEEKNILNTKLHYFLHVVTKFRPLYCATCFCNSSSKGFQPVVYSIQSLCDTLKQTSTGILRKQSLCDNWKKTSTRNLRKQSLCDNSKKTSTRILSKLIREISNCETTFFTRDFLGHLNEFISHSWVASLSFSPLPPQPPPLLCSYPWISCTSLSELLSSYTRHNWWWLLPALYSPTCKKKKRITQRTTQLAKMAITESILTPSLLVRTWTKWTVFWRLAR